MRIPKPAHISLDRASRKPDALTPPPHKHVDTPEQRGHRHATLTNPPPYQLSRFGVGVVFVGLTLVGLEPTRPGWASGVKPGASASSATGSPATVHPIPGGLQRSGHRRALRDDRVGCVDAPRARPRPAFAVLTAAVAADALRPVDRYAIHHLQPFAPDSVAGTIAPSEPENAITPIVRGHRSFAESLGALGSRRRTRLRASAGGRGHG